MPSKKLIIQDFRREVKEKTQVIKNQRVAIAILERKIEKLRRDNVISLESVATTVERLRGIFYKELAWQELSSHPNTQLRHLTESVKGIRHSVDHTNKKFIDSHLKDALIKSFYNKRLTRNII